MVQSSYLEVEVPTTAMPRALLGDSASPTPVRIIANFDPEDHAQDQGRATKSADRVLAESVAAGAIEKALAMVSQPKIKPDRARPPRRRLAPAARAEAQPEKPAEENEWLAAHLKMQRSNSFTRSEQSPECSPSHKLKRSNSHKRKGKGGGGRATRKS